MEQKSNPREPREPAGERLLRVALLQLRPDGNRDDRLARGTAACRQARDLDADIALFPEMWSTGYARYDPVQPGARERWARAAIAHDDTFVAHFRELAVQLDMAIGLTYFEKAPGRPRNSIALFDRHGDLVLHYSKVHTCEFDWESALEPGDVFPVAALDTTAGAVIIGAMICFDREFPESARVLMLAGAEIILIPNACEMEANRTGQLRARAMENMLGVALANYAGPEYKGRSTAFDGIAFTREGHSRDTCLLEAGDGDGVHLAVFDLDALRDYRGREVWGNAYRRPRLYGTLVSERVEPPFLRPDATH